MFERVMKDFEGGRVGSLQGALLAHAQCTLVLWGLNLQIPRQDHTTPPHAFDPGCVVLEPT